jgi:hypothetical protein
MPKTRLILAAIGFIFFCNTEGWGADWRFLGENEEYQFYFDNESITRLSENVLRIWVKSVFTNKGVIEHIKTLGIKYENLDHSMGLFELNCVKKTTRDLSVTFYSKGGGILGSTATDENFKVAGQWEFIIPETFAESIYREVCKQSKK